MWARVKISVRLPIRAESLGSLTRESILQRKLQQDNHSIDDYCCCALAMPSCERSPTSTRLSGVRSCVAARLRATQGWTWYLLFRICDRKELHAVRLKTRTWPARSMVSLTAIWPLCSGATSTQLPLYVLHELFRHDACARSAALRCSPLPPASGQAPTVCSGSLRSPVPDTAITLHRALRSGEINAQGCGRYFLAPSLSRETLRKPGQARSGMAGRMDVPARVPPTG